MPTDTQRAPTREELEAVGQQLLDEIDLMLTGADADALIIAIAQAIREAAARGRREAISDAQRWHHDR